MADPGDGRAWYVLNTYSGHESRVEKNLDMRIRSMDVADKIFRVVVPTEDEVEIRGGTRRQVQRKLLPGYVLVEMILDDDTWYVVRNTPGVTGFVGTEHPVPLPTREVVDILKQMKKGTAEPRVRVGFEMGDSVRVMEGPFQEFMGEVDEINLDKGKVRVLISMFGRDTPLLLDFIQVEKV
ncbi:MAG: transcription termination/antitermination protein NusG [Chloroflexi bacterium]|nr:transcription termination/antitermination protein NusG [Chloroflexota bacterium]